MNAEVKLPNSIAINQPNESLLAAQGAQFLESAKQIKITDDDSLRVAAAYLTENKAEQKRLDAQRVELVDPLNKVVKSLNAMYKPVLEVLTQAEGIVKRTIGTYQQAEQQRIAKEQVEAEERARKERARLQARADAAAEKGQAEKAEVLNLQAASTVAVIPQSAPTRVAGMSTRKVWVAEVTDIKEVCRLIASGELPPTLVEFKTIELNRIANTWQNNREFPGLRITADVRVASR
jgi:hypothetical protein